ncbi:hypothetical protein M0804_004261 [Polistes exclamans]|nr:hypothetical protein M0804_004261 [Polistes exclamans]
MGGEEGIGVTTGQPNLYKQDLSKLDVSTLTALSREVISRQATINIGTIGHVAHGKSTIVKAISGVQTVRFKNELERNITIKLEHPVERRSKEQADIPGESSSIPDKRSLSPESNQQCSKKPKIDENTTFYPDDSEDSVNLHHNLNENILYSNINHYFKLVKSRRYKIEISIKEKILRSMLCDLRREQLELLKDWENEMNSISKKKPLILVENLVDLEGPPENFFYIEDYLPGEGVIIPEDPPIGCNCVNCGSNTKCCFVQNDSTFPYTLKGKIRVKPGTPIYECNKRCKCDMDCPNRIIQRGTNRKFCIFKTDNGRGWGVKTLESIKKGSFVTQYVGEVISSDEADKRGKEYDAAGRTYLFDLDYNEIDNQCLYTVDAAVYGNISHFINHSCDPNLTVYGVWIDCLDPNLPKLALFATKDIQKNEEVTFDYVFQPFKIMHETKDDIIEEEKETDTSPTNKMETRRDSPDLSTVASKVFCKCGAKNCRNSTVIPPFVRVIYSTKTMLNIKCVNGTIKSHLKLGSISHSQVAFIGMNTMSRFLTMNYHKNYLGYKRYANAKIYKCDNEKCPRPACYISGGSSKDDSFPCLRPVCSGRFQLVRHVSFVDCPGHDILMATMLNGAAVMDAALLLIAGNESCPQPQTSEHLAAIEIMKLKHIIILQNKIDLVKEAQAKEQYEQILKFVQGTVAEGAPVIPISAQLKYNIEVLCEYITKKIPVPLRDFTSEPRLIVIRSFDVNKPGCEVDDLKGGVAGGSILRGVLKVGMEIEVRPGLVSKDSEGKLTCRPIFSRIVSLFAEQNELQFAVPGGLIGVGTKIEPTLCRADRLVGQILGAVGALPKIFIELEISYYLLKRLLGVRTEGDKKGARVPKLSRHEVLLVNIGSLSTGGRVVATRADLAKISLTSPVCTEIDEKIALSRRIEKHWRLIGWGQICGGQTIEPVLDGK